MTSKRIIFNVALFFVCCGLYGQTNNAIGYMISIASDRGYDFYTENEYYFLQESDTVFPKKFSKNKASLEETISMNGGKRITKVFDSNQNISEFYEAVSFFFDPSTNVIRKDICTWRYDRDNSVYVTRCSLYFTTNKDGTITIDRFDILPLTQEDCRIVSGIIRNKRH